MQIEVLSLESNCTVLSGAPSVSERDQFHFLEHTHDGWFVTKIMCVRECVCERDCAQTCTYTPVCMWWEY